MEKTLRQRLVYSSVVPERGQNVVDEATVRVDVSRIVLRDPRHSLLFRDVDERTRQCGFASAGMMELHFHREAVAAHFPPLRKNPRSSRILACLDLRAEGTGGRSG